jgi:predicted MFS family arabinose efflux permease
MRGARPAERRAGVRGALADAEAAVAVSRSDLVAREGAGPSSAVLLADLCLVPLVGVLGAAALAPFFPLIAADLGTSVAILGQIPAAMAAGAAALGLVVGPLADRHGDRPMLLVGLTAVVASSLATALAPSLTLLFAAAAIGAASRAILQPIALAVAGAHFAGEARRRAIGLVMATVSGAAVVGVPVLTMIGAAVGWRPAFGVLALLAVGLLVVSARVLPRTERPEIAPTDAAGFIGAYAGVLRHPPTVGLVASYGLTAAGMWGVWTYLGAFLAEEHRLGVAATGAVYSLFGAGFLVGSLAAGGPLGRLPLRPLAVAAIGFFGALLAGVYLLPLPTPLAVAVLPVATALVGVSTVARTTLLVGESPAGRATTMTLNTSAQSLGAAVGSSVGGLLLALVGYAGLGLAVLVFTGLAALFVWLSRPRA